MTPGCPGTIGTGSAGELLCLDPVTAAPVGWIEVSSFPSTADAAEAFSFGIGAVLGFWIIAKSLGMVLQAIKRW